MPDNSQGYLYDGQGGFQIPRRQNSWNKESVQNNRKTRGKRPGKECEDSVVIVIRDP